MFPTWSSVEEWVIPCRTMTAMVHTLIQIMLIIDGKFNGGQCAKDIFINVQSDVFKEALSSVPDNSFIAPSS
jgi:hypothetical protein